MAGGRRARPDAVIAATGYGRLERLVGHLGVLDRRGLPLAASGEEAATGLAFIGYRLPHLGHLPAADARRIARGVGARGRASRARSPGDTPMSRER